MMPRPLGWFQRCGRGWGSAAKGIIRRARRPFSLVQQLGPAGTALWAVSSQSLFHPVSARGVAERTPSFMYPQGTASSQMVLRGMDLLLECIASGVYVRFAPRLLPTPQEDGLGDCACSVAATFCRGWGGREKQTAPNEDTASHGHPIPAIFLSQIMRREGSWASCILRSPCDLS